VVVGSKDGDYSVKLTGAPFDDAYHYVVWLLTVPMLLMSSLVPWRDPGRSAWTLILVVLERCEHLMSRE
jgi:hypothetical protein